MLWHSSTSTSQLPPATDVDEHCAAYAGANVYAHIPLAKPATHAHVYACAATAVLVLESAHVALLMHGLLRHSFTSTSQIPVCDALAVLSITWHSCT